MRHARWYVYLDNMTSMDVGIFMLRAFRACCVYLLALALNKRRATEYGHSRDLP